jgi:plastocyanin
MRPRTLSRPRMFVLFALAALLGAAVAVLPASAAAPSEAKLEVNENCEVNAWPCWTTEGSAAKAKPTKSVTIASGGTVTFVDHGEKANIAWMGTPPTCEPSVPVSPTPAKTGWEGKCTFQNPGTYKFESSTLFNDGVDNYTGYEIVVEGAATGTTPTTPSSPGGGGTTTSPPSPAGGGSRPGVAPASPLVGSPSGAIKLARTQHGSSVRGSVKLSQAGAGGRLEVGLFAAGASPAKAGHSPQVRVGRLVRLSLHAGTTSFTVPLNAKGKAALRHHRRLALTVKITLTPLHGAAVTVTRGVVVRA